MRASGLRAADVATGCIRSPDAWAGPGARNLTEQERSRATLIAAVLCCSLPECQTGSGSISHDCTRHWSARAALGVIRRPCSFSR